MRTKELDHLIEKSFRTEPVFHLSADFAQKVTYTVVRHEQWKTDLHEYMYLTAVLSLLLIVASGFYYYIDKEFVIRILSFVSGNVIQVVFVLFILNFVLFADRVLLRLLFNRWKLNE